MYVFSVSVAIKENIAPAWRQYMLEKHINDVLKTGCFHKAEFEEIESIEDDIKYFRARYYFENKSDYERYIENYSADLRGEHNQLYGEFVEVQRTVSELKEFYFI